MRVVTLALCLTLAACRTTGDPAQSASPSVAPAASPTVAEPVPPPAPAPRRGAAQATRGSAPPAVPSAEPEPPAVDQILAIRQMCWSEVDKNRAIKALEARADWVSKCIADKSKAAGF